MKRMSFKEFHARAEIVNRAYSIFGALTEGNLNRAFLAYQKILAEQERSVFINTQNGGRRPPTLMDLYKRPRCPVCQKELRFRIINEKQGKANRKGWKSQWYCETANCTYEEYSTKNINWWMRRLRRKEVENGNR